MRLVLDQVARMVGGYIPSLFAALAILVVGWLVAKAVSAVVGRALARTSLDNRLASWIAGGAQAESVDAQHWVGRGVYYLIILFVLIAFFQTLGLTIITEPLSRLLTQIIGFAPRLLGAGLLLLVAWIAARVLRTVVKRVLTLARLDERLGDEVGQEDGYVPLAQTVGEALYWLVFLLFLPAVLGALGLSGLLQPVQGMIDGLLGFVPSLIGAGAILIAGWFLARVARQIVTNLLVAVGSDRLSDRLGLTDALGEGRLSGLLGMVVYVLILIPVLIAGLNALKLEAITRPASEMLSAILGAIPAIFAAGVLLGIAYVVGRVVTGLITSLLAGAGFNRVLAQLGVGKEPVEGERSPSDVVGYLILVAIMLFASMEAARLLGFVLLAELVAQFLIFASQVAMGLIVFAVGLYLANLVSQVVRGSGADHVKLLALGAKVSILVLAGAMALRQMGLANEIINMAFGLLLGAISVAVALAFGLGGREVAARELESWLESVRSERR